MVAGVVPGFCGSVHVISYYFMILSLLFSRTETVPLHLTSDTYPGLS